MSTNPGGDLGGADAGGGMVAAKAPVGVQDEGTGGVDAFVVQGVDGRERSHEKEGTALGDESERVDRGVSFQA